MVRDHLARLTLACCLGSLGALGALAIGGADRAALVGGAAAIACALIVAATPGAWRGARAPADRPLFDATLTVDDVELIDEGDAGIDSLWRLDLRVAPTDDDAVRRWAPADLEVAPMTPMLLVARDGLLAATSPLVESAPATIERLHVLGRDGLPGPAPGLLDGAARLRVVVSAPPDARRLKVRHGLEELGEVGLPVDAVARTAAHVDAGAALEHSVVTTPPEKQEAPRAVEHGPWDTAITRHPVRALGHAADGKDDDARPEERDVAARSVERDVAARSVEREPVGSR